MTSFDVVVGHVVADFKLGFCQSWKADAIEQFGFEAAPKGFRMGRNPVGRCRNSYRSGSCFAGPRSG